MGRSLAAWSTQVLSLVRDVDALDVANGAEVDLGIRPAFAQYSIDRPRYTAVDLAASGRYLPFPTAVQGWDAGMSSVVQIEAPAGQTPPSVLLDSLWQLTRDPTVPATARMLIPSDVAGRTCRVVFTTSWPIPTADPTVDLISDVAFSAVSSLAAAMVLTALSTEAARDRMGSLPSDFVDGSDRSRNLLDAAAALRVVYNTFIGLGVAGATPGSARQIGTVSVRSAARRMAGL
jgi:hypothetical protein